VRVGEVELGCLHAGVGDVEVDDPALVTLAQEVAIARVLSF
jgi:hypothetical protein